MFNEEYVIIAKTIVVGISVGILGLFNAPIFDTILGFLWFFDNVTEAIEIYSKFGGAVVVTLTVIYLIQKITGKRK